MPAKWLGDGLHDTDGLGVGLREADGLGGVLDSHFGLGIVPFDRLSLRSAFISNLKR